MKKVMVFILVTAVSVSCGLTGEEIGRIDIDQLSSEGNIHSNSVDLVLNEGDELSYWALLDIEYEGDLELEYQVELIKDGKSRGFVPLDAFDKDITLGEVKTSIMNKTKWQFSGRIAKFTISESGTYTFKAILVSNGNKTLNLKNAALVFKK